MPSFGLLNEAGLTRLPFTTQRVPATAGAVTANACHWCKIPVNSSDAPEDLFTCSNSGCKLVFHRSHFEAGTRRDWFDKKGASQVARAARR